LGGQAAEHAVGALAMEVRAEHTRRRQAPAAAVVDELDLGWRDPVERDAHRRTRRERRELLSEQVRHPRDLLPAKQRRALADPLDPTRLTEIVGVLIDRERDQRVLLDVTRALG